MDYVIKKNQLVNPKQLKMVKRASDVDFEKIVSELHNDAKEQDQHRINKIKAKVMTVARFNLILKKDRENHDLIERAKKMYPDGKLKPGEILHDFKGTKYDLDQFIKGHN